MVLELRPAHDPNKGYGFVGVVTSTADLSRVGLAVDPRRRRHGVGARRSSRSRPSRPRPTSSRRSCSRSAPSRRSITDIALSVDDRSLYVSCWGTGELKRFDVSDPRAPRETGSVRLGGIVGRAPHPAAGPLNGGPQMVEVSRDGRRVFLTNSLYAAWDAQFYPEGIDGWLVKLDAGEDGSLDARPGRVRRVQRRAPAPGPPAGRRRVVGLLLLPGPLMDALWPWVLMALLGAYHGLNPAMGWLFAVALGMQERDRRAVLRALPPIALGHEASVVLAAALVLGLGLLADTSALHMGAGIALVVFGDLPLRQAARALPLGQGARRRAASSRGGRS